MKKQRTAKIVLAKVWLTVVNSIFVLLFGIEAFPKLFLKDLV